jgi:hypothetical protein
VTDKLLALANAFIEHPFPLWESELTAALVENKWIDLNREGLSGPEQYNTAWPLTKEKDIEVEKLIVQKSQEGETIYCELPLFESIGNFYEEHGLILCSKEELVSTNALEKLKTAFSLFELVPGLPECLFKLVRCIQVIKQDYPETDTSYSHPKIPFSIFVSVCQDNSPVSALRVAESILHEAMHLKLTLLENVIPLINPNSTELFYSPWRGEERPIRGVLHGLFVFRAIYCLIKELNKLNSYKSEFMFGVDRLRQLELEIIQIESFPSCSGLTEAGASLSKSLLPSN